MITPIDINDVPLKPREGSPCNGCGMCCISAICPLGQALLGQLSPDVKEGDLKNATGPCPVLEWEAETNRFWCGLIRSTTDYVPSLKGNPEGIATLQQEVAEMLGTDTSCDAKDIRDREPDRNLTEDHLRQAQNNLIEARYGLA